MGTVLDARVLQLDLVTILAIARDYGDEQLHGLMQSLGMSTAKDSSAGERLAFELGLVLAGTTLGTRRRGRKPGDNTEAAFQNLASIARNNDGACNRAIAKGLVDIGLVESVETEKALYEFHLLQRYLRRHAKRTNPNRGHVAEQNESGGDR